MFLLRARRFEFIPVLRHQALISGEVTLHFLQIGLDLIEVGTKLTRPFILELNAVFDPGDLGAVIVKTLLDFIQLIRQLNQGSTFGFDLSVDATLIRNSRFLLIGEATNLVVLLLDVVTERVPAQAVQAGLQLTLFFFKLGIALRRSGLAFKMVQLALKLFAQVTQAVKVVFGMTDAALGFTSALLVPGDACCLLEVTAQLFRLGLDQVADHALLDDRVAAGAEPGAKEQVGDVLTPALLVVKEVM